MGSAGVQLSSSSQVTARKVSTGFTIAQRNRLFIIACLIPASIALLAIVAYPFFYGFYLSLTNANPLTLQQDFIGSENYRVLLSDSVYRTSFRLTVIFTAAIVLIEFPLAMGVALMLNEPLRGRVIYRALLLVPWVMPNVVAAIIWQWIYSPDFGLLDFALWKLSIIDSYIDFLGNPDRALPAVIAVGVWKGLPFSAVVLLAGLQAVPADLHEAATIDGANAWRRFRDVTIPHLLPIIVVVLILRIVWTFNSFDLVYVLTGGGPGWATQLLSIYVYLSSFQYQQLGYGAAMAVSMLIALAIPAALFVRRTLHSEL
jgi:multiple sugar transport system permease protein